MTNTDKLSLDEARKHLTSEFQKSERLRLWENHMNNVVARARARARCHMGQQTTRCTTSKPWTRTGSGRDIRTESPPGWTASRSATRGPEPSSLQSLKQR